MAPGMGWISPNNVIYVATYGLAKYRCGNHCRCSGCRHYTQSVETLHLSRHHTLLGLHKGVQSPQIALKKKQCNSLSCIAFLYYI
jgi:hypothetical protein